MAWRQVIALICIPPIQIAAGQERHELPHQRAAVAGKGVPGFKCRRMLLTGATEHLRQTPRLLPHCTAHPPVLRLWPVRLRRALQQRPELRRLKPRRRRVPPADHKRFDAAVAAALGFGDWAGGRGWCLGGQAG